MKHVILSEAKDDLLRSRSRAYRQEIHQMPPKSCGILLCVLFTDFFLSD